MYCYRCGSDKKTRICPICGADEIKRFAPQTAEGKKLRELFDMQEIGPNETVGNPEQFEALLTDVLPGEQSKNFRRQIIGIISEYIIRCLIQEQLNSQRLPDSELFTDLCQRALVTGYTMETCQHVIRTLYEMIGWQLPTRFRSQSKQEASQSTQKPFTPDHAVRRTVSRLQRGCTVIFGHYPQTASGADRTPIEWEVLDVQEKMALLISKYGLDTEVLDTSHAEITWEKSTLRAWLNKDFLKTAFGESEQNAILTTNLGKVYLLSHAEAFRYFDVKDWIEDDGKNSIARIAPTDYAIERGAHVSTGLQTPDGKAAGWWWLRSIRYANAKDSRFAFVDCDGSLNCRYSYAACGCVRPVCWVNTDSFELSEEQTQKNEINSFVKRSDLPAAQADPAKVANHSQSKHKTALNSNNDERNTGQKSHKRPLTVETLVNAVCGYYTEHSGKEGNAFTINGITICLDDFSSLKGEAFEKAVLEHTLKSIFKEHKEKL